MKQPWKKIGTREYSYLFTSYVLEAYKVMGNRVGATLHYNIFYGQKNLVTFYRLPEDIEQSYKKIEQIAEKYPRRIRELMNEYGRSVRKLNELLKPDKKISKTNLAELIRGVDKLFLKTLCSYLFFVYLGYAAHLKGIKHFLKNHGREFKKIRTYKIDTDVNTRFPKLIERYEPKLNRLANCLSRSELLRLLKGGALNLKIIESRKLSYLFVMRKGIVKEFFSEQIDLVLKKELPNLKSAVSRVSGKIAYPGKVSGRARIVFSLEDCKKLIKGEILITPMTKPNMAPYFKGIKAIVTNDGGTLSHASIISRELKIPCVVGTTIATDIFKDGDLVEVDADKGVVKILKKD